VQPGGFPVQIRTNDHFNLEGSGSASGLHVGFAFVVTVTAPGQFTFEYVNTRGNPACDPI
jgi:hypothetical protein